MAYSVDRLSPELSFGAIVRGDLLARVIVEVPTRLNSEQRRKLEEFANSCGEENTPLHRTFFERAKDFFR